MINKNKCKGKKIWKKPIISIILLSNTESDPYDPGRENGHGQHSGTHGPS